MLSLFIQALSHEIIDGDNPRKLLNKINLSVAGGECIALMGDSGSGKTTLLNLIAGLEPIQQGNVEIAGISLTQANDSALSQLRKQYIGIIFQQFNLLTSLSVQDNIEFSAKLAGNFEQQYGLQLADQLGISHLLTQLPATLSGGEMQRVAIARALNSRPKLLLADEPTGNLDENNTNQVVEQLVHLAKLNNTALLMVTHSASVAKKMDKIYRLKDACINAVVD